jgi:hypothetical protein
LGLLLAVPAAPAAPAAAAGAPRCFGTLQYDLDGDGQPDQTVIDCAFATERDFVYVYDGAGDMRSADRWEVAGLDFQNDTWLFDAGADGRFDLAITFAREDGKDVAYLYDDQNGDGQVSVRRSGRRVVVDESPYWTARVESGSTWVLPDGTLNQNVRALVDGPLSRFGFPEAYLRQLRTSGRPKWETAIVDADDDGIPEYAYSRLLAPSPSTSQLPRTGFNVNTGRHKPEPADGYLFWPLLGGAPWYGRGNYFDSPFHVGYDWGRRKLTDVYVTGYPIEEGYHINTLQYFARGRVNFADFENPMAYYDLAGDRDGLPELFVRLAYVGQGAPFEEVTYSWNQYNAPNLSWHFKLGLAGKYAVETQDRIGDFDLLTVPHDALPGWVVDRPWDLTTFVAAEGGAYASSEGIYEWAPLEGVIPDATTTRAVIPGAEQAAADYLLGRSSVSPAPYFDTIRAGFRAEYREIAGPATFYFSPIDRRLHLLGAQKGVWNLGDGRELRYASTGGDYLNAWSLRRDGAEVRALWHVGDQLVLADEEGVRLRQVDPTPAGFTTAPPTDHESWLRLGEQLGDPDSPAAGAGADPRAMFDRQAGPLQVLPGATARDLRAVAGGFRFVLGLPAGGAPGAPLAGGLAPGEYVVSYSPGAGYQAQPLTPTGLTLGLAVERQGDAARPAAGPAARAGEFDARQPLDVAVRLRNAGLEDARAVRLDVVAVPEVGPEQPVGTATLDAEAAGSSTVTLVWTAPDPGRWTLRARARTAAAETESSASLVVHPEAPLTPGALLTPQAPAAAGVLALLAGAGATAFILTLALLRGPGAAPPAGRGGAAPGPERGGAA